MYATQAPYRDLYEALLDHDGDSALKDVLLPWVDEQDGERRFLERFAVPCDRHGWPSATDEDLCRLYAAGRVNELLLLAFQPATEPAGAPSGAAIDLRGYVRFMGCLGFRVVNRPAFDPFFHEIVTAGATVGSEEITITSEHWPTLMLGDLLFSRAGCSILAPTRRLDPSIATRSTLHWAHRRRYRPTRDLSVGWGSNSQWRTRFRRDYRTGGMLHFNVDGTVDAAEAVHSDARNRSRQDLTAEERIELLTHRCFVRTRRPDDELWPWDERHSTVDPAPIIESS